MTDKQKESFWKEIATSWLLALTFIAATFGEWLRGHIHPAWIILPITYLIFTIYMNFKIKR